ncbi:hypothetical protein [Anabaena sp. CCY 9910]|uniref:hypothetical protein n=1 Tax=Anabaena sp. CCY 9910 TaxID=3103870 RepID=UPI0039E0E2C4
MLTSQGIQQSIDSQVQRNLELLQRVIEKQISEDFRKGEKQIDDYINRFQSEFEYLIKERVMKEVQADEIIADLETQRIEVNEYLHELTLIRELLDNCKPTIVN